MIQGEQDPSKAMTNSVVDHTTSQPRWRLTKNSHRKKNGRLIAIAGCVLATLAGTLFAFGSLRSTKPRTSLVSLYMAPNDDDVSGVDAPHSPSADQFFGLGAINQPSPLITDWQDSLDQLKSGDQVVLHVSALARIEHCQVFFYGRENNAYPQKPIALTTVLDELNQCAATNKLLVLEVHWPLNSDQDNSKLRLSLLNANIDRELKSFQDLQCHVLLSSSGDGASRGISSSRQTLMSHFLTKALEIEATDSNHDGLRTLQEVVDWANPKIIAASISMGTPQKIQLRKGEKPFYLPTLKTYSSDQEIVYPAWLTEAWKRREVYCEDWRYPWMSELANTWAERLCSLESRWRRGEPDASLLMDLTEMDSFFSDKIDQAILKRNGMRLDSLRMASDRFPRDSSVKAAQLAANLIQQATQIIDTNDPEERGPIIDKAVASYIANFEPKDASVSIVAILRLFDDALSVDRDLIELVNQVCDAWGQPLSFPVSDAISLLLQGESTSHRNAQILRIFRIQDRLGSHQLSTASICRAAQNANLQLATVQRLIWNPGMISQDELDLKIEQTLNNATAVFSAEQAIELAVRRLQMICNAVQLDRQLGIVREQDRSTLELNRRIDRLASVLGQIYRSGDQQNKILASQFALLRQASEALKRHWTKMIDNRAHRLMSTDEVPNESISTGIPAILRAECLSQNTASRQNLSLFSNNTAPSIKTDSASGQFMKQSLNAFDQVTSDSAGRYRQWWTTFIGETREIDAIKSYQRIAERRSISGAKNAIQVAVESDLQQLTWDDPFASIQLHYLVDLQKANPVEFDFLTPSTDRLTIQPSHGILEPGQISKIDVSLALPDSSTHDPEANFSSIQGVWLRLRSGTHEQLLPIRMSQQPSLPSIDIQFGQHARTIGRHVQMELWPNSDPQPLHWSIKTNDPKIKKVLVSVASPQGEAMTSAPIEVFPDQRSEIQFLPPEKQATPDEQGNVRSNWLKGELKVLVTDPDDGKSLGQWSIESMVRDPRTKILPGDAEYHVDDQGRNRLEINLQAVDQNAQPNQEMDWKPTVRIDLDSSKILSLIDFGESQIQAQFSKQGETATLFAKNLRFAEGLTPVVSIPVLINGIHGYYELEGRFPRRKGTVQLQWKQVPTLRLLAPAAILPGTPLEVTIQAHQINEDQPLVLEVLGADPMDDTVLWRSSLPTSREPVILYQSGGKASTATVAAGLHDWNVPVPTDFGTGPYRLHVSTKHTIGDRRVIAEHRFLIDQADPQSVHARAQTEAGKTTIYLSAKPPASGIEQVSISATSPTEQKKTKALSAIKVDEAGTRWKLSWPKAIAIPEEVQVTFHTGSGKIFSTTTELPIQQVIPIGRIAGHVLEGSIPQPNLEVTLYQPNGTFVSKVKTDADGSYLFSVPPGDYLIEAKKLATQRTATVKVTSKDHQTVPAELKLLRAG